jgi:hypothetical protein
VRLLSLMGLCSECWGIPGIGYYGSSLNGRFKYKHPFRVVWTTTIYLKGTAASGLIERKQSTKVQTLVYVLYCPQVQVS